MGLMNQAQQRAAMPGADPNAVPDQGAPDQGAPDQSGSFKRPDVGALVPPDQKDTVDRIAAAGMKLMYAPEMRQHLMDAVKSQDPTPQKLAMNTAGLILMLDKKTPGGLPVAAIFPAAMELLGEAAEVLSAAGVKVSQQDYNDAGMILFGIIGKKLGAKPDQLMQAAKQALPGGGQTPGGPPSAAPPPQGVPPAPGPDQGVPA